MGLFDMLVSVPLLLEYESVLKRNDTLVETGLTLDEVDAFVDVLTKFSVPVTPFFLWRPMLRDPKDDMLLELAVAGAADCIVSFNIRDLLPARARFGIGLERPKEFWKIIRR
ncbi:MAG: hypothetical protein GHCLOJNM_03647 [bacterium]|nr:hypothetical protein [bacterium]